jgi:ABC-type transport system substrate-binding protein
VKTESLEAGTMISRLSENVSNFNIMGWGQTEPDMLRGMTNGITGLGKYHDETYQTLVSDALKTTDPAERTKIYFQAAQKMLADCACVPLWTDLAVVATRAEVKGYKLVSFNFGMGVLDDVTIEE